jgi:diguanylate cyclase (GGDEF)-like protein
MLMGQGCSLDEMAERLQMPRAEVMERVAVLFSRIHREYAWIVPGLEGNSEARDSLTGLKTRDQAVREIRRLIRQCHDSVEDSFCVAFLDIDGLKGTNDRLGHSAGDRIIGQAVAEWLRGIRPSDVLYRWGGDEFVLVLPSTSLEGASSLTWRLQTQSKVPFSVGVAGWTLDEDWKRLVDRADREMYRDKHRRATSRKLATFRTAKHRRTTLAARRK